MGDGSAKRRRDRLSLFPGSRVAKIPRRKAPSTCPQSASHGSQSKLVPGSSGDPAYKEVTLVRRTGETQPRRRTNSDCLETSSRTRQEVRCPLECRLVAWTGTVDRLCPPCHTGSRLHLIDRWPIFLVVVSSAPLYRGRNGQKPPAAEPVAAGPAYGVVMALTEHYHLVWKTYSAAAVPDRDLLQTFQYTGLGASCLNLA